MSQPYPYRQNTHPLAVVSLVLSILGLMPVLPLVGPIAAIVTGVIARREIRSKPDQLTGDGIAKAGIILGVIGLVFVLLAVLALLLFLPVTVTTLEVIETVVPVQP
jgi:hypothetical protein